MRNITKHTRIKKTCFRFWYVTLAIAVIATVFFVDIIAENNNMMQTEENPFGAIGLLMVYGTWMGILLLVMVAAWIATLVLAVKRR